MSTDLTEQISRRFPGYSRRNLKKKSRTCLHCFVPNELYLMEHVMMSSNQCSSLCYSTDYNINNIFILHSSMHKQRHIINFRSLHKNFQEDHLNSRRFPGYSRRDLKKKSRTCLHCFVPNELYLMEHVMQGWKKPRFFGNFFKVFLGFLRFFRF